MSSFWFTKAKEALLSGSLGNLTTATLKIVAVDTADYTVAQATHQFLSAIPSAARIATATLASVTVAGGVLDAADVTLSGVSGDQFEALVIYEDSGTESTSYLLIYMDTGTGLPYTPSSGDIAIAFASTGIAAL